MKKLISAVMPLKSFAAMIFTGFICLYMVTGVLCDIVLHQAFVYTIPFIFVLQGLLMSVLISVLWGIFLGDKIIKGWRYFPRLILFSFSLMVILAACFLTFLAIPTNWAKLWLLVSGCIAAGVIVLSIAAELYLRATGKRYTEILKEYQTGRQPGIQ